MATAFASGSWTRIRWCCHQGDRKTLIKHSRRAGGYSPRPGHRPKFNRILAARLFRHQYAVEMRLSVSQRSSEWVVRLPDVVPLWTVKSLGWPARSLVRPSKKRPFIPSLRFLASDLLAGVKSGSPSRRLFAISTNLVNLRAEGKEPQIRSETVRHRKKPLPTPSEPILYYLQNGPKRGFVCGDLLVVPAVTELPSPSWHLPQLLLPLLHLHVTLYRLRLDVVLQNPAFFIVRAQPQLFVLIGAHHSFVYSQPSVCGGIYVPLQRFVAPVLVQFVLSFLHRFWGRFYLAFFVLSVITLAGQGNHASALKLELKHPGFAFNPFGPSKPFFFSIFETPPATPGALLLSTNHMITQNTNCQYFVQPCACFPWLSPQTA